MGVGTKITFEANYFKIHKIFKFLLNYENYAHYANSLMMKMLTDASKVIKNSFTESKR